MSKRFGRNQRRKLRAELAAREQQIIYATEQLKQGAEERHSLEYRLQDWARRISRELGPEHPLNLEIIRMVVERLPYVGELMRFAERPRISIGPIDRALSLTTVAMAYVDAAVHLVEMEPDRFTFSVRALLRSRDGASAYVIDRAQLDQGRRDPRFVEWLSQQVAERLSRHMADAA